MFVKSAFGMRAGEPPFSSHYWELINLEVSKGIDSVIDEIKKVPEINLKLLAVFAAGEFWPREKIIHASFAYTAEDLLHIAQQKLGVIPEDKDEAWLQVTLHKLIKRKLLVSFRDKGIRTHYVLTPAGAQVMSFLSPHMWLIDGVFFPIPLRHAQVVLKARLCKKSVSENFILKHCAVASYGRQKVVLKKLFRFDIKTPCFFEKFPLVTPEQVVDTFMLYGVEVWRSPAMLKAIEESFSGKEMIDYNLFIVNFIKKAKRRNRLWEGLEKLLRSISMN